MSLMAAFKRWLSHPLLHPYEMGSGEWFAAQKLLLAEKPLVDRCYSLWYDLLLRDADSVGGTGRIVEIGSGLSHLKKIRPEVITSDVVAGSVDLVVDGRRLPFTDSSLRALVLTHVFHHIPDVERFLAEASRVLVPGGVISIVDCAHTPFSRFFFGRIHPEPYRHEVREWSFPEGHTMLDSNQALTWLVFERDRSRFEALFPGLQIEQRRWLPWFSYLLSGGVNLRSFIPRPLESMAQRADDVLTPLDPIFAVHWHWTIRKRQP